MKAVVCSVLLLVTAGLVTHGRTEGSRPPHEVRRHSVADFYKNVRYYGASFSHDGSRLLVSSNASGTWNAYAVPTAGGKAEALTHSTADSIFTASYFPNDLRILYTSDEGGNELSHVFVRNVDGTTKDLTPGQKHNARFFAWAADAKSFFVGSNERDARFFDLYEYDAASYARTLFYRNEQGLDAAAISPDKRFVALGKSRTTNDADVWLLDRRTGQLTNLTAHEGDVSNTPAAFSPDGTRLLFISDQGREFRSLRSYDLASAGKKSVLEPKWDIRSAGYTTSGRYLIVEVNEDAAITTRLYDAGSMREVALTGMPGGIVRGLTVSRSDTRIGFYASDGSTPDDLYAGSLRGSPRRLTNALNPAIDVADLVVPRRISFKSYDNVEIPGLLYTPRQSGPLTRFPAVVRVHGGPGGQAQVTYSALTQALVNDGYVVFDINNRGSTGYGKTFYAMDDRKHGEADLGDVVASKQMLVATGIVDPARIGIMGGSYGGYMVLAALTLQPDAFQVGVDMFGISNWVRTLTNTPVWWGSLRDALYAELGDPKTDAERLHRISPIFSASRIKVPLMVLQGANDPRVLQVESDEIIEAAKKNGVPTEYIVFADEGHGFIKKDNEIRGYTAVLAFLDRYLKSSPQVSSSQDF